MASAGYSGTSLVNKLGIKSTTKILLMDAPDNYPEIIGSDIRSQLCSDGQQPDMIHFFARNYKEFSGGMERILGIAKKQMNVVIWISWYKKASKIPTDITEDLIRDFALQHGLVDIKVCAIDTAWSGLKLVVPLAKRK